MHKKQDVTSQSLQKIEDGKDFRILLPANTGLDVVDLAIYAIVVRGSEYDLSPEMLDDIVVKCVSSFGGGHRPMKGHHDLSDDEIES